jgi:transposase InsO family protein
MTDNGPGYRSIAHAALCRQLGIRHLRAQPYRPKTNGKACVLGFRVPSDQAARLPAPVV